MSVECDSCGYEFEDYSKVQPFKRGPVMRIKAEDVPEDYLLCDLCAGTFTGSFTTQESFRNLYTRECEMIMQAICHVGNVLLAEIRGTR